MPAVAFLSRRQSLSAGHARRGVDVAGMAGGGGTAPGEERHGGRSLPPDPFADTTHYVLTPLLPCRGWRARAPLQEGRDDDGGVVLRGRGGTDEEVEGVASKIRSSAQAKAAAETTNLRSPASSGGIMDRAGGWVSVGGCALPSAASATFSKGGCTSSSTSNVGSSGLAWSFCVGKLP